MINSIYRKPPRLVRGDLTARRRLTAEQLTAHCWSPERIGAGLVVLRQGSDKRTAPRYAPGQVAACDARNVMTRPSPGETTGDRLTLFGQPNLLYANGRAEELQWSMPVALLAYLACKKGWHSRESLATLLRPEVDLASGKAYVRRLLHRTRALLPGLTGLQAKAEMVRWAGSTDVEDFEGAVSTGLWSSAADIQRESFLASCQPTTLEAVDDFFAEFRRRLVDRLIVALTSWLEEGGSHARSADLMQRLSDLDPLNEDAIQFLLTHATLPSERAVAASCFERLQRRLAVELGASPQPLTFKLLHEMRAQVDMEQLTTGAQINTSSRVNGAI